MRISTLTMFDQSVSAMNRQQGEFLKVGQQIASGRRVVNPSDDPQASSRALGVSQSKAIAEQYMDARIGARNALSQEEQILNSISDAIASAKTLMVQAASDTLGSADRVSLAAELKGIMETVLGQANASDGNGRYLFGGYQDSNPPFVRDATGAIIYVGDNNTREQRIDASRLMPVADNGQTIFQSVHSGAGYVATAAASNTGTVTFVGPTVINSSDPDYGANFVVEFSVVADVASYSVNGAPSQPYQSGEPIIFGGLSLRLDGIPGDGDTIAMGRASQMNTDLFVTLQNAINVLENPPENPAERAHMHNTISTVMRELDNSLDNVLTVRASAGAKLNELDIVDGVGSNRILNYKITLSELVDLDYVEAIAEYSLRQVGLQAAQKSFVDTSKLSLFNLL